MNVSKEGRMQSFASMIITRPLPDEQAQQMLALGQERDWDFALLGNGPLPDEPISLDGWKIVPAEVDTSPVPSRSIERINTIFQTGLRPKGFVVVHEAPALLPAYVSNGEGSIRISTIDPSIKQNIRRIATLAGSAILGVAILPGILAIAMAVLMVAAALILPFILVAGLAAIDPILVAVTEDGSWIEIDRWWTEE